MRLRRVLIIAGLLIVLAFVVWIGMTAHWNMQQPKPQDFTRLVRAMQEFSRDKTAAGQEPPATVSIPDLIATGYLPANDAKVFADMDVSMTRTRDAEGPETISIRIRLPDGSVVTQAMGGAAPPGAN